MTRETDNPEWSDEESADISIDEAPNQVSDFPSPEISLLQEIRDDIFKMIPALRAAISRNSAFEAMDTRLKKLEAERSAFPMWKFAGDIHKFRIRMSRTEMDEDLRKSIEVEIKEILARQGFKEFGDVDEEFSDAKHRILDKRGKAIADPVVNEVVSPGLSWMNRIILQADVIVGDRRKKL